MVGVEEELEGRTWGMDLIKKIMKLSNDKKIFKSAFVFGGIAQ